jgi:hypothetical protein
MSERSHPGRMAITQPLAQTLAMIVPAASNAMDEWWLIGSAAVALHGGNVRNVRDVDLMMSARDADALLARVGGKRGGTTPSQQFQSDIFGIWSKPPLPVEIFGGFRIFRDGAWRAVAFATRERRTVDEGEVYVPSVEELVRLLHAFGRPKDLERARLLKP